MPNPKRKHTPSRRDSRRASNWRLETAGTSACKQCGGTHVPHRVCPHCGFYRGELVVRKREKKPGEGAGGPEGGPAKE